MKSQFIGKDHDAGKDSRQEEKGTTEDNLFGWHHRLKEHESEQALGDSEGQGSLVCPWGHRELDTTEHEHDALYSHRRQVFVAPLYLDKARCGYLQIKDWLKIR